MVEQQIQEYKRQLSVVKSLLPRERQAEATDLGEAVEAVVTAYENQWIEDRWNTFCPYDNKYKPEELVPYLSASALMKYCVKVQAGFVHGLYKFGKAKEENVKELEQAVDKISAALIYTLESKVTKHDIRGLLMGLEGTDDPEHLKKVKQVLNESYAEVLSQGLVSEETASLLHPGTTSYDVLDTARAMMYKEAMNDVIIPQAKETLKVLVDLAEQSKEVAQVGRTHGQWTSPTLFGYVIASFAYGLAERIEKLEESANALEGKVAGIVGTGASPGTIVGMENALEFERIVLEDYCDVKVSKGAQQTVRKEKLADIGHYIVTTHTVLSDMANDMRHLQRSEIMEVAEGTGLRNLQGSSADPGKANPINWENTAGLLAFVAGGMNTLYAITQSNHQRDLRNSTLERFEPTHMMLGLQNSLKRQASTMQDIVVFEENMAAKLEEANKFGISECLNAILRSYNFEDSHGYVAKLTKKARKEDRPLLTVALEDDGIRELWDNTFSEDQKMWLTDIKGYTGVSRQKTDIMLKEIRGKFGF